MKKETLSKHEQKKRTQAPALHPWRVKGLLAFQGKSILEWSRERGYSDAYVHLSMRGMRSGPKARRIVAELKEELGL